MTSTYFIFFHIIYCTKIERSVIINPYFYELIDEEDMIADAWAEGETRIYPFEEEDEMYFMEEDEMPNIYPPGFSPSVSQDSMFVTPSFEDGAIDFNPMNFAQAGPQTTAFSHHWNPAPPFSPPHQRPKHSRCMNRISFVRLFNGRGFWFFPTEARRDLLIGFRWRRNRWQPDTIEMHRIRSIDCN